MASDPQQPPRTIEELESLRFGFDDLPLDHFRGLSAEEIEAHDGIGPKFRQRIQAALAELDAQRGDPSPEPSRSEGRGLPATESQPTAGPHPVPAGGEDHAAQGHEPAPADEGPREQPESIAPADYDAAERAHEHTEHDDHGEETHEADESLEPASPTGSGPLVFLMVLLIVAILVAVFMMAGGREKDQRTAQMLATAQAQLAERDTFMTSLADDLATDAEAVAEQVYRKVRMRNFGEAVEHLDNLEKTLRNMTMASGAHQVLADRQQAVADAQAALEQARAAVLLSQPMTQAQVEAAAQRLQQAVAALQGQEVKE